MITQLNNKDGVFCELTTFAKNLTFMKLRFWAASTGTIKGLFIWETEWDDFYPAFRWCFRTGRHDFYPVFMEKKSYVILFGSKILRIYFSKMALININSQDRNLQVVALNTSILNFFAERTSLNPVQWITPYFKQWSILNGNGEKGLKPFL